MITNKMKYNLVKEYANYEKHVIISFEIVNSIYLCKHSFLQCGIVPEKLKNEKKDLLLWFNFTEHNRNNKMEPNSPAWKRRYEQTKHKEVKKPTGKSNTKWF